jgi:hypothetical protein
MAGKGRKRTRVRVTCPQGVDGAVPHMTADELLARAANEPVCLTCPRCGRIHLDSDEVAALEEEKIVDSARYWQIRIEAED